MFSSINFMKFDKHFESKEMNYKYYFKTVLCENEKPQIPTLF